MKKKLTKKISNTALILILILINTNYLFAKNSNYFFIDKEINSIIIPKKMNSNVYQLFTHGKPGELLIEGKWCNAQSIVEFLQPKLNKDIQNLNIYGCEFAKGTKGLQAVAYLEKTLGISVSASTNITGKDGDWVLEVGKQKDVIALNNFNGNLQTCPYGTVYDRTYSSSSVGANNWSGTANGATGAPDGLFLNVYNTGTTYQTVGTFTNTFSAGDSVYITAKWYDAVPSYPGGLQVSYSTDNITYTANSATINGFNGSTFTTVGFPIPASATGALKYIRIQGADGTSLLDIDAIAVSKARCANTPISGVSYNDNGSGGGTATNCIKDGTEAGTLYSAGMYAKLKTVAGVTAISATALAAYGTFTIPDVANGTYVVYLDNNNDLTDLTSTLPYSWSGTSTQTVTVTGGVVSPALNFCLTTTCVNGSTFDLVYASSSTGSTSWSGTANGAAGPPDGIFQTVYNTGTTYQTVGTFTNTFTAGNTVYITAKWYDAVPSYPGGLQVSFSTDNITYTANSATINGFNGSTFTTVPFVIPASATGALKYIRIQGAGGTSLLDIDAIAVSTPRCLGYPISGVSYNDNGSGGGTASNCIKDGTETGTLYSAGMFAKLKTVAGITAISATALAADGTFTIPDVANGTYVVFFDNNNSLADVTSTLPYGWSGTSTQTVTVTNGVVSPALNFCLTTTCLNGSTTDLFYATSSTGATSWGGTANGATGAPNGTYLNTYSTGTGNQTVATFANTFTAGNTIRITGEWYSAGYTDGILLAFSTDGITYTANSAPINGFNATGFTTVNYTVPASATGNYTYVRIQGNSGSTLMNIDAVGVQIPRCLGFPVNGVAYNDNGAGGGTAANCTKDGTESGSTLPSGMFAKIKTAAGTSAISATTLSSDGTFTLTDVANGTYLVYLDDNNTLSDITPANPLNFRGTISQTVTINNGVATPALNFCLKFLDTDGDGIGDDTDLDDDNDGILDVNEMYPTSCPSLLNGIVDGSFESAAPVAWNENTNTASLNSTLGSSGWSMIGSPDTWTGSFSTSGSGYWAGAMNGVPATSDGNVFAAIYNGFTNEGMSTTANLAGQFTVGDTLGFNFKQIFGGCNGITGVGAKARFRFTINGVQYLTDTLTYNGNNPKSWQNGIFYFVPNSTTLNITIDIVQISNSTNDGNYLGIDGIKLFKKNSGGCDLTGDIDTDGDGIPNRLDLDSDGDGCPDAVEAGTNLITGATTSAASASMGVTTGTVKSVINGPYGGNGFADILQAVVDTNNYKGVYTYNSYAIVASINACTDTDGDGITDLVDLDDDNDGILDAEESECSSAGASILPLSTSFTPTVNSTAATFQGYLPVVTKGYGYNTQLSVLGDSIVETINFSTPLVNPIFAFTSVDFYSREFFDQNGTPIQLTYLDGNGFVSITGNKLQSTNPNAGASASGVGRALLNGTNITSIKIKSKYITSLTGKTSDGWDIGFYQPAVCDIDRDTDGDGIPDRLDLDSDGDGCPDAKEGNVSGTLLVAPANMGVATGTANSVAQGLYGANGLANSLETNDLSTATTTYTSTYAKNALTTSFNICTDTDGDGISDLIDLDDDNDGVLDAVESPNCYYNLAEVTSIKNITTDIPFTVTTDSLKMLFDGNTAANFNFNIAMDVSKTNLFTTQLAAPIKIDTFKLSQKITSTSGTADLYGSKDGIHYIKLTSAPQNIFNTPTNLIVNQNADAYLFYKIQGVSGATVVANTIGEITFGISAANTTAYVPSANPKPTCITDTDGDGIPNQLDLDSDGDGCPDVVEAGTNLIAGATTSAAPASMGVTTGTVKSVINGSYNGNGFADVLQAASDTNTYKGTYTYNMYATNSTLNFCIDSDGDGISDIIDLDDDNDGILDVNEMVPACSLPVNWTVKAYGGYNGFSSGTTTNYNLPSVTPMGASIGTGTYSGFNINAGVGHATTTLNSYLTSTGVTYTGAGDADRWAVEFDYIVPATGNYSLNTTGGAADAFQVFKNSTPLFGDSYGGGTSGAPVTNIPFTAGDTIKIFNAEGATCCTWFNATLVVPCTLYVDIDTDGDGIPNRLDLDSDGDGCPDAKEAGVSALTGIVMGTAPSGMGAITGVGNAVAPAPYSANGFSDFVQASADTNTYKGIYTYNQYALNNKVNLCDDCDGDGIPNVVDLDDDNDGILDAVECPSCYNTQAASKTIYSLSTELSYNTTTDSLKMLYDGVATANFNFDAVTTLAGKNIFTLTMPTSVQLDTVKISQAITGTGTADLYGSNDGITFVKLTTTAVNINTAPTNFVVNQNSGFYKYYKVQGVSGSSVIANTIGEISTGVTPANAAKYPVSLYPLATGCPANATNDKDGDGVVNSCDLDADGDGCSDAFEAGITAQIGVTMATGTLPTNAVVAPPYGNNGFADILQTSSPGDTNTYKFVYTYSKAIDTAIHTCVLCSAGNTAPVLTPTTITNICPSTKVNLTTLNITSTKPVGTSIIWSSIYPITSLTDTLTTAQDTAISVSGKYYVMYFDKNLPCNSPADSVVVTINVCPTPDSVTVTPACPTCPVSACVIADDLTAGGQTYSSCGTPAGYTQVLNPTTGCLTLTPNAGTITGGTTCVVACKNGVCDTTYVIINPPVTPDTNKVTPACPTCPVTSCVIADDLTAGGQTYSSCGTPAGYTQTLNPTTGCLTLTPNAGTITGGTTCVVACKNGVCDTTYVIINPPVTPDTNKVTPACPTCPVTSCVIADDLTAGGQTYSSCGTPAGYTQTLNPTTGCLTLTPNAGTTTGGTTCVVACKNGVCDTTYVIINPPVTPDTNNKVTPACPTCPVTSCVIADDLTAGGQTYSSCGTPAGYTQTLNPTTGCLTLTPNAGTTTGGTTCVVACKNGVCDTTYVIINPPVTPDTNKVTPACPTCPVTSCVIADDLTVGGQTYSSCGTPAGYTQVLNPTTGCLTLTPNAGTTTGGTTCVVACKNGVCDTTYVIINPPVTPDTNKVTPACPTCAVTSCVIADDLTAGGQTYSSCGTPAGYTQTLNPATGCLTLTPNAGTTTGGTTCVVACKNGVCDTTYVIINPPVTPDTNKVTPACPTCAVTSCVIADDLTAGGQTYSSCGTPAGYTQTLNPATGCLTLTPNAGTTTGGTTCVVACKNGVCDTTYVIINPPVTPDSVTTAPPACPTCSVIACTIGDDLTGTGSTIYSTCGTPSGYTVAGPDPNGCYTYTPNGNVTTTVTTCQVACKNGTCDTTYVIIKAPVTPDTNKVTPACPTCPVTSCVIADDLTAGGQTYSSCGTPAGYTQTLNPTTGCLTLTPNAGTTTGGTTCVVACKNGVCDTTYVIINPPVTPDTNNKVTPACPTCPVTSCVIADDLTAGGQTYSSCGTPAGYTQTLNPTTGCLTLTPNAGTTTGGTTCVVACKNGVCDTTYVIINPPVTPDTNKVTPACPTCPVTSCVIADDLTVGGQTYSSCGTPAGYTQVLNPTTGCLTLTPNAGTTTGGTTCVVACKNGVCDTTYVIINPPVTPDTNKVTPACPTCAVTSCVIADDLTAGGQTYSSCGTPAGYTQTLNPATGCLTLTPNAGTTTGGTTCVVACKNGVCDTTYVIINPPVTPDTNKVTPACPTCAVTSCVIADDLTAGGQTYSSCGTPAGYTQTLNPATGCLTLTPNAGTTTGGTTCVVACKNGVCDTTYIIINPSVTPDSVTVEPTCPTCPVAACAVADDLPTGIGTTTYSSCGLDASESAKGIYVVDLNGCLVWLGNSTFTIGPITTCIVACKNGVCDTTYITINAPMPPYGPDTVHVQPTCSTCSVTKCATGDDIPTGSTNITYSTCSTTSTHGTWSQNSTTGCLTWLPNGTQTDTVKNCVVVCGTITVGSITTTICDTTFVIVLPPPTPDTLITSAPICPTCPVIACTIADDVAQNTATAYSTCGTPIGYSVVGPNVSGCYTYTPNGMVSGPVTTCQVACNNGICDTTYITIPAPKDLTNPDFNITNVNVPVSGNLNTNDQVITGTIYGTPIPNGTNPSSCTPVMAANGTYSFVCSVAGEYNFLVPVCPPGQTINCPLELLTITVLNPNVTTNAPTGNPDYGTTIEGTAITIDVKSNDKCNNSSTCTLSTPSIVDNPTNGTVSVDPTTGKVTYTPNTGFVGNDTLQYVVCDNQLPTAKCDTEYVFIDVLPLNSPNTTSAIDDYNKGGMGAPITGNVKTNDTDPEKNTQTVTPQNITIPGKGTFVLLSDGSYTFTSVDTFKGPIDIPYTICDNGTPQACATATLHILVQQPDITPNVTVTPNIMHSTTSFNATVKVTELNLSKTNGLITVRIPKDSRLSFTYNPSATMIGFTPVSNTVWTYNGSNSFYHIFTTTAVIPKGGFSTFGFIATFIPGNTDGKYTMTGTISSGSGSENRTSNNTDAESLDYFHN